MKREKLLWLLPIIAVIAIIFMIVKSTYSIDDDFITSNDQLIGGALKIKEAAIIERKTGTIPFDNTAGAGNDISADNDIVRSFDQVIWTIGTTMILKNPDDTKIYKGGVLFLEATMPSSFKMSGDTRHAMWDVESMKWAHNPQILDDGRTFTGYYKLPDAEPTASLQQTLSLVLKVLGAQNDMEIKPDIKLSLVGNDESEKASFTAQTVKVSATPKINVKVKRNTYLNYKSYFDFTSGDKVESKTNDNVLYGRMQGYGIALQLYNTDFIDSEGVERKGEDKQLKGIELPTGPITFDLRLSESLNENGENVDVSNRANFTPQMWDYYENVTVTNGKANRNMYWQAIARTKNATKAAPYNSGGADIRSCYNGGTWQIVQDNNDSTLYHVTVKDYVFNPNYIFPMIDVGDPTNINPRYGYDKGIGAFSTGYVQAIMQVPVTYTELTSVYMKIESSNLKVTSVSGQTSTTDVYDKDDMINSTIQISPKGSYEKRQFFQTTNVSISSLSPGTKPNNYGDASVVKGSQVYIQSQIFISSSNDTVMQSVNILQKFDDKIFTPAVGSNSDSGQISKAGEDSTLGEIKVLYAAKPDGSGWNTLNEMDDTREEDLIYYENYADLVNDKKKCVAILYEHRNVLGIAGSYYYYRLLFDMTDAAEIGKTYQTVNDLRVWETEDNDFSWLTGNKNSYPSGYISSYNTIKYVKTEYDESGQIVSKTHNTYVRGNTLLIVGANQSLKVKTDKQNYDVGKNELIAKVSLTPSLTNKISAATIKNVNLKITTTLPSGTTYQSGSSNVDEPTVTNNDDGTTTLIYNVNNVTANEAIPDITFDILLDQELENNTDLQITGVVSENLLDNETSKIGNTEVSKRSSVASINIINLATYTLNKVVTTPYIEVNGTGKYIVSATNKTDFDLSNFTLLDILPYNGDNRGTNFHGSYTIEKIVVTTVDSNGDVINNNIKIYATNKTAIRSSTPSDVSITGMTLVSSGATLNGNYTGIVIVGNLQARVKLNIELYLKTKDNEAKDIYVNSAMAKANEALDVMESQNVEIRVISRLLDGHVWIDTNQNGLIDNEETYVQNMPVILLDKNNVEVARTTTDDKGYYKFENMAKGNYKVKVDYVQGRYTPTIKGAGTNTKINSKIDDKGVTDAITGLNKTDKAIIKVNYINAGLIRNPRLIVKHLIININEPVPLKIGGTAETETSYGVTGEDYTTTKVDTTDEYELVSIPKNANGTFEDKDIEVIYYYKKKNTIVPQTGDTVLMWVFILFVAIIGIILGIKIYKNGKK